MLDRIDETIVAVSSAAGYGEVSIVRLAGPDALGIANRMARGIDGGKLADCPGHTRVHGEVAIGQGLFLPAVFYVFRAPRSYTRQDTVEIQTVGSPAAAAMVRQQAIKEGAIAALGGEFTARAFLNGAMDLSHAEAVGALIRAQTDQQLRAARRAMQGDLSKRIKRLRDELAEVLALVEAEIDFAEEPIDFIRPEELEKRLATVAAVLRDWREAAPAVERLDVLPRILLLGPPNAGKSSLMNRLSGIDRSICEAVAGTTRDILSAPISLERGDAILLDAAGIDQSTDKILSQARTMALTTASAVDLVCLVVDAAAPKGAEPVATHVEHDITPRIIVVNKRDLVSSEELARLREHWYSQEDGQVCTTSAATGEGIDELRSAMTRALDQYAITVAAESIYLTERQRASIVESEEAIVRASALGREVDAVLDHAELVAFELREALDALGRVTGEVSTEDLLSHVFAGFCIGK